MGYRRHRTSVAIALICQSDRARVWIPRAPGRPQSGPRESPFARSSKPLRAWSAARAQLIALYSVGQYAPVWWIRQAARPKMRSAPFGSLAQRRLKASTRPITQHSPCSNRR